MTPNKPKRVKAVKVSDYVTPKKTGKKKKPPMAPPPAPKIRPIPSPLTPIELLRLDEVDDLVVKNLSL